MIKNQILERYQITSNKSPLEDQIFYLKENLLTTYYYYQNTFPTQLGSCHFHDERRMDSSPRREGYAWLNSL